VRGVPGGLCGRRPTSSGCSPSAGTRSTGGASTSGCADGHLPRLPGLAGEAGVRLATYLEQWLVPLRCGECVTGKGKDMVHSWRSPTQCSARESHFLFGGLGPRQLVAYGLRLRCNPTRTSKKTHTALVVFRLGRTT
jgi:hypothetical protein